MVYFFLFSERGYVKLKWPLPCKFGSCQLHPELVCVWGFGGNTVAQVFWVIFFSTFYLKKFKLVEKLKGLCRVSLYSLSLSQYLPCVNILLHPRFSLGACMCVRVHLRLCILWSILNFPKAVGLLLFKFSIQLRTTHCMWLFCLICVFLVFSWHWLGTGQLMYSGFVWWFLLNEILFAYWDIIDVWHYVSFRCTA